MKHLKKFNESNSHDEECVKKVKIEYPDYNIEYKQFTQGFVPNAFVIRITLRN